MSRDSWKQLTPQDWTRRLAAAQVLARAFIARNGLDITKCEDNVAGLILESDGNGAAAALWPSLQDAQQTIDASMKNLRRHYTHEFPGVSGEPLDSEVFGLSMAAVEAGFLFGVIVGSNLSPAVVAAMPAPYAPPVATKPRAGKKGGTR